MEDEYRAKKIEAVTIELVPVRFDIKLLNIRQKFGLILVVNSRWYTPDIEVIVEKDGSIWVSAGFDENAKGGVPSTIIDLTGEEVKMYREGNIKLIDVLNVIKE